MSTELARIAADILIAKINTYPGYATKSANEHAEDLQTIYNQIKYGSQVAAESELGKKHHKRPNI